MQKIAAGLMANLGLAGAMAAAWAGQLNVPATVTPNTRDRTVMQAPAIGTITTAEGTWTFGSTARAGGDYPLLGR